MLPRRTREERWQIWGTRKVLKLGYLMHQKVTPLCLRRMHVKGTRVYDVSLVWLSNEALHWLLVEVCGPRSPVRTGPDMNPSVRGDDNRLIGRRIDT